MGYATPESLTDRAGEAEIRQIADRDRDGVPDAEVVAAALADADRMIDGYVGVRYALPLDPVPPVLGTWAVAIARYLLHRNGAPEHVAQDCRDAVAALKDVAAGRYALPVAAGEAEPEAQVGRVMAAHPPAVFTPARLRGW